MMPTDGWWSSETGLASGSEAFGWEGWTVRTSACEPRRRSCEMSSSKERVALADVMSSIHEGSASKRRVRPMRTIVIAGGAYLLGTRAGRERYQQILGAFRGAVEDIRQRWRWSPAWESAGLPDAGVPVVPDEPSVVR